MKYSLLPNLSAEMSAYFRHYVPSLRSMDWSGCFRAVVNGEEIAAPVRIYNEQKFFERIDRNSELYLPVLCLYTRHHNGFLREEALNRLLEISDVDFAVIPYVLKLAEEYVIEIVIKVADNAIRLCGIERLKQFTEENPQWVPLMRARCISYWNCYYRKRISCYQDYPGIRLIEALTAL